MAYFIVIGTNNDVKNVVDEMKNAHLQHNVVTSGCILFDDQNTYYHWDVYNASGDKTNENNESVTLHDALTNQISQFKTLLPSGAIPNVFVVSNCFDEKQCETLQMVCDELYKVGGSILSGILVDIVLLGYDLSKPEDVTRRPHWRILESIRGLGVASRFHTDILYVNNMDYMGAATNIDSCLLGRFLCHWSKIICSGGYNPKSTVNSNVYSIGISEHQYDFQDLNDFFKLSAEERLLDRTLNNEPSPDTQELLDYNYFSKIDLGLPWIDGLRRVKKIWESYCATEWDPSKHLSDNVYSVSRQEQELASYLNLFLKLYIEEENEEIENLNREIDKKETEKNELLASLPLEKVTEDGTEQEDDPWTEVRKKISQIESEIDKLKNSVYSHESNIAKNSFIDADEFCENFGTTKRITEDDEEKYQSNFDKVKRMIEYVKSDAGIDVMRKAIECAINKYKLPQSYPASSVYNLGRLVELNVPEDHIIVSPSKPVEQIVEDHPEEKSGCLMWFFGLFSSKKPSAQENIQYQEPVQDENAPIDKDVCEFLKKTLNETVLALKTATKVHNWWNDLCEIVDRYSKRLDECKLLMDGEKDLNGNYVKGKEGYRPKWHTKSISLIDMDLVRKFRDTDGYYKENIEKFLERWFDKGTDPAKRMTMPQLIKHQVLDPLVGRFHTLYWDGSNPFVNEDIPDDEMHKYIDHDLRQSKPFVEYVLVQNSNIVSGLNMAFFSNNKNIPEQANEFRKKYEVASDNIVPVYLDDFVNSLCVVQVMDIPEHVDALKDFKPKREYELSRLLTDIKGEVADIVGEVDTVEDKTCAIYNWLCDNIAYDTTKTIHDAETCWRTKRGVCQAYSELFCHMAETVGVTADVIVGKTKNPNGEISDEKHAWVFVHTHGYEGILIDPTWGAGGIDGVKFVKSTDRAIWYDVSPYWLIFSHFPDDQYWTRLDIKVTEEQFAKLPYKTPSKENDGKNLFFESLTKIGS